jgi:predicted metalloendopeptidase
MNKNKSKNKSKKNNNKTKKVKQVYSPLKYFTQKQRDIICNSSPNLYNSFEEKLENVFKKNNLDIVSSSYNLQKEVIKELKKAVNKKNIMPNNDFYSYINDRWMDEYSLEEAKKYIVQVDDFRIIQDKVFYELIEIIENYISNPSTKDSKKALCIKTAYKSFNTFNTDNDVKLLAKTMVEYIDELRKDKSNLWERLGVINRNEITNWGCPFVLNITTDEKNPEFYKCYLYPPKFSMIDTNVYFDLETDNHEEKKYKKNYKKKYFTYLDNLFTICFGENHGFNIKDVYDTEVEIMYAMGCSKIKDTNTTYNLVTKEDALKKYNFEWEKFCKSVVFKDIHDNFVTNSLNYLLCGTKLMLEKWDSPQWRTFWIYLYIRQMCRWHKNGSINYYEFEGNFVRGQEIIIPNNLKPIFPMGLCFNEFLTNEYVTRYNNLNAINYIKNMLDDLRVVFIRIIKRNKWLQPKTKEKALLKLNNFKVTIGSPKKLIEDPLLDYKEDDPWGNIIKIALWRNDKLIKLVGKKKIDIPLMDWSVIPPKFIGTQAYVVNAYYTPTENRIYIPLGLLQKPLIDLEERGIEYNLARVGYALAHEMSHALDNTGSKYDEKGVLNNWWLPEDSKKYKKIQEDVAKQYRTYASYDNIDYDPEIAMGENLADISAMAICQEYLRDFQLKNDDILPIMDLSFKAFYTYYAVFTRQKIHKKAVLAQLKTNPHPLEKYRCNVPLSRSKIFRNIYSVEKKNKMWWHNFDTIW